MSGGKAMSEEDIADVAMSFARAARDAKSLGFDALEFHGAHGYLFDQFFWAATNKRADRYGGTGIGQRTQCSAEVVRAVRKEVGEDFALLFRLSQWKMVAYDAKVVNTPGELEAWIAPLVEAGVDIFHCSQRRFWEPEFEGSELNLAGWVKKISGHPTMTVGSVGLSSDLIETLGNKTASETFLPSILRVAEGIERGDFDLVAVGRAMLADSEWANKVQVGRFRDLRSYSPDMVKTLL